MAQGCQQVGEWAFSSGTPSKISDKLHWGRLKLEEKSCEVTGGSLPELLLHVAQWWPQWPVPRVGLALHCLHGLEEGGDIVYHHLHGKTGQEKQSVLRSHPS